MARHYEHIMTKKLQAAEEYAIGLDRAVSMSRASLARAVEMGRPEEVLVKIRAELVERETAARDAFRAAIGGTPVTIVQSTTYKEPGGWVSQHSSSDGRTFIGRGAQRHIAEWNAVNAVHTAGIHYQT